MYVVLNKIIKFISLFLFVFYNVDIGIFKNMYVIYIIFLLDSTDSLGLFLWIPKDQFRNDCIKWYTYKDQILGANFFVMPLKLLLEYLNIALVNKSNTIKNTKSSIC